MPNWCSNSLQITAPAEKIAEIKEQLDKTNGENFFDIFVKNAKDAGKEEDWYDYNLEHYGCKWNCTANDWDVESGDGTTITISFDSPWGPPTQLFETIQSLPGHSVYASYFEPGMCLVGEYNDGSSDDYDYGGADSSTIYEHVPDHLVDCWGIHDMMVDYEAENQDS